MARLDQEYRSATGLNERRHYSIFYSQIDPSPVLILGFNPGGNPDTWDESALASTSFYENGEHEYVDCHYPIAVSMRQFLKDIGLINSDEEIRPIPKTNIVFRRSRSMDGLKISDTQAIEEAKPVLDQIIKRVAPTTIIFEGISTKKHFEKHYCEEVEKEIDNINVETPNGRYNARIYMADRARLTDSGRKVLLLGIGHPSKYSGRAEWRDVVSASRNLLSAG